jgi:pre-rRNA-processing protein IPI1
MLQKNSDLFLNYELNHILESVCPLFIDREYKIRKQINEFIKLLLNILLKNDKLILLKPFYKLINAHLSCAMTHIDENIQYNSLIILDIFIQYLPDIIYLHSYNIFENFIEQISKVTSCSGGGGGGGVNTTCRRVLKNDPYKLTSTQSWRSNVLARLYKILVIVARKTPIEANESDDNVGQLFKFNDLNECLFYNKTAVKMPSREMFKLRFLF